MEKYTYMQNWTEVQKQKKTQVFSFWITSHKWMNELKLGFDNGNYN